MTKAFVTMALGETIRQYREAKNLTQPQLAALLDVSKGAISQYEKNQSVPSLEKLNSLAKIFGVRISQLVDTAYSDESVNTDQSGNFNQSAVTYKSRVSGEDRIRQLENQLQEEKMKSLLRERELLEEINKLLREKK